MTPCSIPRTHREHAFVLLRSAVSWTMCLRTLSYIANNVPPGDGPQIGLTDEALEKSLHQLREPRHWLFLADDLGKRLSVHTCGVPVLEAWFLIMCQAKRVPWTCREDVPRDFAICALSSMRSPVAADREIFSGLWTG